MYVNHLPNSCIKNDETDRNKTWGVLRELWHHWEIRHHEAVHPSGQHLSQPRRMWYKLQLKLKEAPSVVALTPQGPLAEVGLGSG